MHSNGTVSNERQYKSFTKIFKIQTKQSIFSFAVRVTTSVSKIERPKAVVAENWYHHGDHRKPMDKNAKICNNYKLISTKILIQVDNSNYNYHYVTLWKKQFKFENWQLQ